MLEGMGLLQVVGSGSRTKVLTLSVIVAIWNAGVFALWAGAITAGVLVAKDLL